MNIDQIEIITQYLRIETNYAVIINGEYGIGKTHFYKNYLIPEIKKVSLPKNEQKAFIPIHISLFGIKSIEDLQTAIFLEIYPILKNKSLKLAASIGKSIIRGIAQIHRVGDIDKYIGDLNQDKNNWLRYDELVICFDDLDRKSQSLDLRDVFGFINSLVENQGAKILIIENRKELLKDINYSASLIEKVIGVSIQYEPNIEEVFMQIISERYSSGDKLYYKFLKENINDIIQVIQVNQNNFRNFIFFLEHFKTIFYLLEKLFEEDKEFEILKTEKLKAILEFTLAIAFEFKSGALNVTNVDSVINFTNEIFDISKLLKDSSLDSGHEKDKKPAYIQVFREKYFSNTKYFFFKSILDYITGIKAFNKSNLKIELQGYFILKDGKIPESEKILEGLIFYGCLNLSMKEYNRLTREMLLFVDTGQFQLNQYPTVFQNAVRFNNILDFDLTRLITRFKKGIERGKSHFKYTEDLGMQMSVSNHIEFKKEVNEIIQFCLKINEYLKSLDNNLKLKTLFDLFQTDFKNFIDNVSNRDSEFRFTPFWAEVSVRKIFNWINKLENENIWKLGNYFINRYRKNIFSDLYPEKLFIIELKKLIDNPAIKRKRKNLHNASLDYLSKCLKQCEENFPEIV